MAPFLFVSSFVLVFGSGYYLISDRIRNRLPKQIDYTMINRIDFDGRF